jgi:drug/metabolite transporter (DMT)-like permease
MSVLLGALGSVLIGISDLFGRRSSGASSAVATVHVAFWAGSATGAIGAVLLGHRASWADVGYGAASGVATALALWALYQAFVVSSVGVASPVTAVMTGVVSVGFEAIRGSSPSTLALVGMTIGVVSLVLAAWSPETSGLIPGISLAALAGGAFAVMLLLGAETSEASGLWPLSVQRATAALIVLTIALATSSDPLPRAPGVRRTAAAGGAAGSLGVGVTFVGLQRAGEASVGAVAVASSFYPAVTVALRWVLDGERLRWWQVAGLVGSLVAVALIALG